MVRLIKKAAAAMVLGLIASTAVLAASPVGLPYCSLTVCCQDYDDYSTKCWLRSDSGGPIGA